MKYAIRMSWGTLLGTFEAPDPDGALEAYARSVGYGNFAGYAKVVGQTPEAAKESFRLTALDVPEEGPALPQELAEPPAPTEEPTPPSAEPSPGVPPSEELPAAEPSVIVPEPQVIAPEPPVIAPEPPALLSAPPAAEPWVIVPEPLAVAPEPLAVPPEPPVVASAPLVPAVPQVVDLPVPEPGSGLPPACAGCLLWWDLEASDTRHETLAAVAAACGFPTIYLPVPVSPEVAFSRAFAQGTAHLPPAAGKWRADLQEKDTAGRRALVQRWAPDGPEDPRPWKGVFRAILAEDSVQVEPVEPDGLLGPEAETVVSRIRDQYDRQRGLATANEIRTAAQDAVKAARAVWVRSGLYLLPGDEGAVRAKSVAAWLRAAGGSRAGAITLHADDGEHVAEAQRCAGEGLQAEVAKLVADVQQAIDATEQGASLRRRLQAVAEAEGKLAAYGDLIAAVSGGLKASLGEARGLLEKAAGERDVTLEAEVGKRAARAFKDTILAVRAACEAHDPASLAEAVKALKRRQGDANVAAFGDLWRRFRQQAAAVLTAGEDARFEALGLATREVATHAQVALDLGDFFGSVVTRAVEKASGDVEPDTSRTPNESAVDTAGVGSASVAPVEPSPHVQAPLATSPVPGTSSSPGAGGGPFQETVP